MRGDEWAEKQRNPRSRGVGVVISVEARAGLGMAIGGEKSSGVPARSVIVQLAIFQPAKGGGKDRRTERRGQPASRKRNDERSNWWRGRRRDDG